jgi:hypothetical protein
MKKILSRSISVWIILSIVVFTGHPAPAAEIEPLATTQVEVLMPGILDRTIKITQASSYPQGVNYIVIVVLGYGGVTIRWNRDTDDDLLFLTGAGISAAGILPVLKFGKTPIAIKDAVAIGSEWLPFGLIWLSSWIDSSVNDPPYDYELTLEASLTFYY